MRAHFSLTLFIAIAVGALIGSRFTTGFPLLVLTLIAGVMAGVCVPSGRKILALSLPLLFFLAGIVSCGCRMVNVKRGCLAKTAVENQAATVEGNICSIPRQKGEGLTFYLSVDRIKNSRSEVMVKEKAFVALDRVPDKKDGRLRQGSRLVVEGDLSIPAVSGRVQGPPAWLWTRGAGAMLIARVDATRVVREPSLWPRVLHGLRSFVSEGYRGIYGAEDAALMSGMTLGGYEGISPEDRSMLDGAGVSHILAVSGLHVGVAAGMAWLLSGIIFRSRRSRCLVVMFFVLTFLILSNLRPSACRATFMVGMAYGGVMLGRDYDPLIGLSSAGVVLLALNPLLVYDMGFQLSFCAALSIVLGERYLRSGGSRLKTMILVTTSAQLGLIPLLLLHGKEIPTGALAANILVVPLLGPMIFLGLSSALTAHAFTWLGSAIGAMAKVSLFLLRAACGPLSRLPTISPRGFYETATLCLYALGLASIILRLRKRKRLFPAMALVAIAICLLMFWSLLISVVRVGGEGSITVLDVGQGDSILMESPGGAAVLLDGGPEGDRIDEKLREEGVEKVDLVISSHPHKDHLEGLNRVLSRYPVGEVVYSGLDYDSGSYSEFCELTRRSGARSRIAHRGQRIVVDENCYLEILYSPADLSYTPENVNDWSLVVMARWNGIDMLFTGDLEMEGQAALLDNELSLSCDALKVPHQGASDAALPELVDAARPHLGLISVGEDNPYGHPSDVYLEMLQNKGVDLLRTDTHGDIEIFMEDGIIGARTEKAP